VTAALASIASAPQDGGAITGTSGEQQLSLAPGDARLFDVRATVEHGGGVGSISVTATTDADAEGAFTFTLLSTTTGEETTTDVYDPAEQSSTTISIAAFAGCADQKCAEETQVSFERDVEAATTLELTWTVDAELTDGSAGDNSISIEIHAADS
jgi:hypothetical protein